LLMISTEPNENNDFYTSTNMMTNLNS
jgi:hypothetical protein